jgi:quinol-cytochrome oxidoreductase complex cytochrome b subunit
MTKHEVSIPLVLIAMVLMIALGILSYKKADSKEWYIYIIIFAVVEGLSILYLAFL